jgi:L-arabinokinase
MSPSYRIVFYVSGHGFGHTSRAVEVMHALLDASPEAAITVKTSAPRRFFERTLHGRADIVEFQCDSGMVQIDSLNVDTGESVRQARQFQARLEDLAAAEASYLRARGASVVVGDIPPLAFTAAAAAGLPSVAIGNFTWDWIYEGYGDEATADLARGIRGAYQRATRVLRLPMAGGFEGLEPMTRDIPFIARHSRREPDEVRRSLGLPPRALSKPLVLMSFGGYGVAGLDTAALARLADYTVATTDTPGLAQIRPAPGILYVSEHELYGAGLRYEDLVRAADVVVTKPGYGIISEAIANDAALLYTSRGRFVEYDVLVREMPRYVRAAFIGREDLLQGRWGPALDALLNQPAPPERPPTNGAQIAAAEILRLI